MNLLHEETVIAQRSLFLLMSGGDNVQSEVGGDGDDGGEGGDGAVREGGPLPGGRARHLTRTNKVNNFQLYRAEDVSEALINIFCKQNSVMKNCST